MKLNDMFPSPYLKSGDFEEEEVKVVTIKDISLEELTSKEGEKQTKPVLAFREKEVKPLVCNITNAKIIAGLYGEDSDEWIGKRVSLFVTQVDSFGKQVDAIRVRAKIPAAQKPAPEPVAQPEQQEEGEELPFENAATEPRREWTEEPDLDGPPPAATLSLKPGPRFPSKEQEKQNGKAVKITFARGSTSFPHLLRWGIDQGYYRLGDASATHRLQNILLGAGYKIYQDAELETYKKIVSEHYANATA